MLDRIGELSVDELNELRDAIVTEFETVSKEDLTREVADQMTTLGNAAQAIRDEQSRRESEAADLAAARDAAAALVAGDASEEASDDSPEEAEAAVATDAPVDDNSDEEGTSTDDSTEEDDDPAVIAAKKKKVVVAEGDPSVASVTEETVTEEVAPEAELSAETPVEAELSTAEGTQDVYDAAEHREAKAEEPEVSEEVVEPVVEDSAEDAQSEETPDSEEVADDSEVTDSKDDSEEETVTAAANTNGLEIEVPEDRRVDAKEVTVAPVTITAGADIPGVSAGSELPNLRAVAQAIIDRKKGMGRTSGGDGEQHTVATFTTRFPENRTLVSNDYEGNSKKVEDVIAPEALVAAGGLCAPVEVSYDIFGLGELGRPVRDSLAVFSADRGGIRFVTPPTLSDLNGAVSLWTLQDDIDAATEGAPDPVKPCIRVACGTEVVVYTDAIPLCLTFGNLGARTYPELVERHTKLGMISHARYAETRLLTRIGSLSTAVTSDKKLGAARDVLVAVDQAAAAYRNRYRMNPNENLRVIFPEWFKNALRADLVRQLPGDGQDVAFNLAENTITSWFAARNINVTWSLDGETGQIAGTQASGALNSFPSTVIWYLFAEGTFLFLDGGTLDLGLVRDSTLNGTNDYKIFLETFEGVAKVGIESLRITTPVAIAGASAATVNTLS